MTSTFLRYLQALMAARRVLGPSLLGSCMQLPVCFVLPPQVAWSRHCLLPLLRVAYLCPAHLEFGARWPGRRGKAALSIHRKAVQPLTLHLSFSTSL